MGQVVFIRNSDCIPAPWAGSVEEIITKTLADRHDRESWTVSHRESVDGRYWEFEFTSNARSQVLNLDVQQVESTTGGLAVAVGEFVEVNWPLR